MKTELFTVSRIFTETLYRIPDYQRGYSWGIDQLNDFWLDLEQIQESAKHYLGVLTLEEVPENKWKDWIDDCWIIKSRNFTPYYVVDGQQRLTTIVLLITAILERQGIKYLNYIDIKDIQKKYIFDAKPEEISRSYIFGYEKDNPSYEFLKTNIFGEKSENHHPKEETIYTKNLLIAKDFFIEKISNLSEDEVNMIFSKVTQQFVFNAYEISNDIDVFVTFETMNNRGKPLSTLELLKNRLIFISTKISTFGNDKNENKLRRIINEAWKSAYHYLGKNIELAIEDDDFLRTLVSYFYLTKIEKAPNANNADEADKSRRRFEMSMRGFNRFLLNELFSQKRIYANGQIAKESDLPEITEKFIYEFSQNVKDSIELYYEIMTPKESSFTNEEKVVLERINRLWNKHLPLLIFSIYQKEKDDKKRINLVKALERLYFIQSFSGDMRFIHKREIRDNIEIQYTSGNIDSKKLLEQIEEIISKFLSRDDLSDVLQSRLKDGLSGYYKWDFINYFLFEYEMSLQDNSKTNRNKIDWKVFCKENFEKDYFTIEHIYPQNARDKYWIDRFSTFTPPQKRLLRNSLGNLLALSKPKNSSLSNKPFPEKRDTETTGYRYGSYSENEVATNSEWTSTEILNRGLKMLDFLENRWKLKIGNKEKKIKALGLTFLTEKK